MGIKLALLNGSLLHIQSGGFITERLWSQNHEHSFTSTGRVGLPYLGQSNSFLVREVNGFENMSQQESRQRPSWQLLKRSEFCQFADIIKTDDVLFAFFRLCHKTFTFTFFSFSTPLQFCSLHVNKDQGCNSSQNMISFETKTTYENVPMGICLNTLTHFLISCFAGSQCIMEAHSGKFQRRPSFFFFFFFIKAFLKFYVHCQCCSYSFSEMCYGFLNSEEQRMGWGYFLRPCKLALMGDAEMFSYFLQTSCWPSLLTWALLICTCSHQTLQDSRIQAKVQRNLS